MGEINRIRVIHTHHAKRFAGTMRNQRVFKLNQKVFIEDKGRMIQTKIVGVELPPVDNPEYTYKVEIPADLIPTDLRFTDDNVDDELNRITLTCEYIFESIEQAKESAKKSIQQTYELNLKGMDEFFSKFEDE